LTGVVIRDSLSGNLFLGSTPGVREDVPVEPVTNNG
jgi:hypothetical protein